MAKAAKTEEAAAVAADPADLAPAPVEHPDADAPAAPRTVRARVLVQCALGAPNDVVEVEADKVKTLGDVIDTDPAAVAYAESQGR